MNLQFTRGEYKGSPTLTITDPDSVKKPGDRPVEVTFGVRKWRMLMDSTAQSAIRFFLDDHKEKGEAKAKAAPAPSRSGKESLLEDVDMDS